MFHEFLHLRVINLEPKILGTKYENVESFYFLQRIPFKNEEKLFFETFWLCRKTAWYESYKVNFKIYDVIDWTTDNHNSYIALYLKK